MRKLNIVFIGSGRNQFIRPYLEYFSKRGHQVSLISYDRYDAGRIADYPIFDASFGAHAGKSETKWKYLLAGVKARIILKRLKPDIVHGHYVRSSGVICLLSGFKPFVISARGSDLIGSMRSRFWRNVLSHVFQASAMVHTVSEQLAAQAKELGVPEKKLATLTQGVDTSIFSFSAPSQTVEAPLKLVCTRRLERIFNPGTIVRACKQLDEAQIPFRLTFAASGTLEAETSELAKRLGLGTKIRFLGGYENKDLPELLRKHEVYVAASQWDGTSVSLLEAMAIGLFPVVSRIEANQMWLDDGKTAFMFEPDNHEELAHAIGRIVQADGLRLAAIYKNRDTIIERADRKVNMEKLENTYYEIVARGRHGRQVVKGVQSGR